MKLINVVYISVLVNINETSFPAFVEQLLTIFTILVVDFHKGLRTRKIRLFP